MRDGEFEEDPNHSEIAWRLREKTNRWTYDYGRIVLGRNMLRRTLEVEDTVGIGLVKDAGQVGEEQ